MATDATGAPTPLGIPKYNTSADAPSGLGFNGAMDVIDTLIAARVAKPAGIASGEVPVWNGTTFDRSSVTKVTANGLTGIHSFGSNLTISGANTDISWGGASSSTTAHNITTGGGTLRSFGAPTGGAGARLVLRNASAGSVTLKHLLAGGSGAQLYIRAAADVVMAVGDIYEFIYDGTTWVEVDRDVPVGGGGVQVDLRNATKDVVNTTAETDLLNGDIDIPANALGANGRALLVAEGDWLNNSGASPTVTLRVKLGSTTIWAATSVALASQAPRGGWTLILELWNTGATNSQLIVGQLNGTVRNGVNAASVGTGFTGAAASELSAVMGGGAAEDTTALRNLAFTAQWSAANAQSSIRNHRASLTVWNVP